MTIKYWKNEINENQWNKKMKLIGIQAPVKFYSIFYTVHGYKHLFWTFSNKFQLKKSIENLYVEIGFIFIKFYNFWCFEARFQNWEFNIQQVCYDYEIILTWFSYFTVEENGRKKYFFFGLSMELLMEDNFREIS